MTETEQIVNVMRAYYKDKKKIQFRDKNFNDEWLDITQEPIWNWNDFDYRIKPIKKKKSKPRYRPFYNMQEILDAIQNGSYSVTDRRGGHVYALFITPFSGKGWGHVMLEKLLHNNGFKLFEVDINAEHLSVTTDDLVKHYYFTINKKPCGVEITE